MAIRDRFLNLQGGIDQLLKEQFRRKAISREEYMKHTRTVTKYVVEVDNSVDNVTAIKEHLRDFKSNIVLFTPPTYKKLAETSTGFALTLVKHLNEQDKLFCDVTAIIRSLSLPDNPLRINAAASISIDLEPLKGQIAFSLDVIQLLCRMKTAWSTMNQVCHVFVTLFSFKLFCMQLME